MGNHPGTEADGESGEQSTVQPASQPGNRLGNPPGNRSGSPRPRPQAGTQPGAQASLTVPDVDEVTGPEDDNDAPADRGLTSEDLGADAREDAGLTAAAKPKIGDTRPAPPGRNSRSRRIGPRLPGTESGGSGNGVSGNGSADPSEGGDGARTGSPRRAAVGGPGRNRPSGGGSGDATTTQGGGSGTGSGQSSGQPGSATTRSKSSDEVVRADLGVDDIFDTELDLDEDALERRRGKTRKGRPAGRYFMAVHVRPDGHTHIAVLEGRSLVEHYVTTPRDDDMSIDGNIYLGRVQNVLPGMEAAFIDIGTPKNGVLYRGDVSFDPEEIEEKQPKIEKLLKNGQNVLVQVTKNPIGAKGARLTQEVSLAGRFVVLVPNQPQTYGISKRMPDDERKRMRKVLDGLRPPDAGLIVRTAAEGATPRSSSRDVIRLRQQWDQISALARNEKAAGCSTKKPPLALRLLRRRVHQGVPGRRHRRSAKLYAEVKRVRRRGGPRARRSGRVLRP